MPCCVSLTVIPVVSLNIPSFAPLHWLAMASPRLFSCFSDTLAPIILIDPLRDLYHNN